MLILCNINSYVNHNKSPLKCINAVLEPELLVNAANNIDAANNMTKDRTDAEAFAIGIDLNIYKTNTKNAVKQALQEALNKLN